MTKIVLIIEGGALTAVLSDGSQVEVAVIDYDADEMLGVAAIPQANGTTENALVSRPEFECNPERVAELFRVVDEHLAAGSSSPSL